MPEIVGNLGWPAHVVPAFRGEAAQREDVPERTSSEQNNQHDCEEEAVQDMLTDAYNKRIAEINAVPKHVIDWEEFKKVVPEQIPSWDEFKDKIVRENGKSNAMIEMIENIRKQ